MVSLKALLNEHASNNIGTLDAFLIYRFFDEFYPKLFSKGGLYRAIQHKVPRPDYIEFELPDDQLRHIVEKLKQIVKQYGAAYVKDTSSTVGGGYGVVKITFNEQEVSLNIPHTSTMNTIERRLDRLFLTDHFIHFFPHNCTEPDLVKIPIMRKRADQPLERILDVLLNHVLEEGEHIIEAPINIPLYNGRTWEIRNIVQCPNGIPHITARYTKVGAGKDFSNILLGGEPEDPYIVITNLYQTHKGVNPTTAQQLTEEYLKVNDGVALAAANALNNYMAAVAAQHIEGLDLHLFYGREFSIDITAEFDENQELTPIVGELQYPLGYNSYTPELMVTDPEKLETIREIGKRMKEQDRIMFEEICTG